jgi:hypothetical protein
MTRHLATIEGDTSAASRYLNYASPTMSSRTSLGLLGRVMGPTTYGEVVTVVSVERVVELEEGPALRGHPRPIGTRLGFRFGIIPGFSHDVGQEAPGELEERLLALHEEELRDAADRAAEDEISSRLSYRSDGGEWVPLEGVEDVRPS